MRPASGGRKRSKEFIDSQRELNKFLWNGRRKEATMCNFKITRKRASQGGKKIKNAGRLLEWNLGERATLTRKNSKENQSLLRGAANFMMHRPRNDIMLVKWKSSEETKI